MNVKLAIIGTGGMANIHAREFQKLETCEIVACCDVIPGRAQSFSKKYGIPHAFDNADELLRFGEFDAVSVVTPDPFHWEPTLKALDDSGTIEVSTDEGLDKIRLCLDDDVATATWKSIKLESSEAQSIIKL